MEKGEFNFKFKQEIDLGKFLSSNTKSLQTEEWLNQEKFYQNSQIECLLSSKKLILSTFYKIQNKKSNSNVLTSLLRYLIPTDFSFHQFIQVIRKRLNVREGVAIYIFFSKGKVHQNSKLMGQIYEANKDEDGFLYCKYASEPIFG